MGSTLPVVTARNNDGAAPSAAHNTNQNLNRNHRNPNPNPDPDYYQPLNPKPEAGLGLCLDFFLYFFISFFLLSIFIFFVAAILYTVVSANDPTMTPAVTMNSFSVSSFNLTADSLSADFDLALAIDNSDSKMSIYYDRLITTVYLGQASSDYPDPEYLRLDRLAATSLAPLFQHKNTSTALNARMAAVSVFIGEDTANSIRSGDASINFHLVVGAVVRADCPAIRMDCPRTGALYQNVMRAGCPTANVAFKNATGAMSNGPIQCESTFIKHA